MKSVKTITQLVLLLLVILPNVFPQEVEEFVLSGEEAVPVYQCTPGSTQLAIQNNGFAQQQYFLEKEGKAAEWTLFETNSLILNPGEKRNITVNFAVPCDASGEQFLRTRAVNTFGEEIVLDQTIIVYTPENIKLDAPAMHEIEPCSTTTFPVTLTNYVNFTEVYSFSSEANAVKTLFSENEITLNPGEQRILTLTVDNSECTIFDKTPLNLAVKTKGTELDAIAEITLQMKKEGLPEVIVGELKTDGSVQKVNGQVKNAGDKREHYSLSIKDLEWVKIEGEKEFTIEPQETKEFMLLLEPPVSVRSGKYSFKLGIFSESLEKEFKKELNVSVAKPTAVQVFIEKYKKQILTGIGGLFALFLIVCAFVKYFRSDFYKKRKLEREKRRQKIREEREKELALKQKIKEERFVNRIKAEAEAELRKKYKFTSKDQLGKARGKQFFEFLIWIFVLGIIAGAGYGIYHLRDSVSNWFAKGLVYLSEEKQSINYLILGVVGFVFLLIIVRMLLRRKIIKAILMKLPANEEVNVPFWKKGITSINFIPTVGIEFGSAQIVKKITKEIIPGVVYGSFKCEFDLKSVGNLKVRFRIPEKFFKQHFVEELRLIAGKEDRLLNETDADKKYRYYEAEIGADCNTLTVYGKIKKSKEPKKGMKAYALAFFLLGAFILAITLVSKPSVEKTVGIPDQTWKQDEKHYIDLGPYFQDPDGDEIEFKASETKHMTIDVVDNIAILIPEKGWTGQELVTFFGEDETGDFAKSNVVRLNVQKRLIPKELEEYKRVIGIVGFFAALIVFLIILKREFVS